MEALEDRYLCDVRELRAGEIWNERLRDFIREADVFQFFWSENAMKSRYVEQEWRYALSLGRPSFIRPTYWEEPMPKTADVPPTRTWEYSLLPAAKIHRVLAAGAEPFAYLRGLRDQVAASALNPVQQSMVVVEPSC